MTEAPEQWQLAIPFLEMVERTIGSVLRPAGFAPSVAAPNDVQYDDGRVCVRVRHHSRDGEVAVDFGRVGREEPFSFALYLGLVAPEGEAARGDGVSWTAEEVESNLARFARALREHGKLILEGDAGTFQRMKTLRWWDVWPSTHQGQDCKRNYGDRSTEPMTEQLAGVDQRGETIIVYSSSTTQVGFWIMNGWFRLLPEPADDESLGRSVIDALSQSRQGVPTPERSVVANAPILKSLGIRSQLAYMKGARHVDVIRHGSRLELRPNENLGRNGFIPISGAEIVSEVPGGEDAVSIGRAVRRALLAAKPGRPESAR